MAKKQPIDIVFGDSEDLEPWDYEPGHRDDLRRFLNYRLLRESTEAGVLERMQEEIQDLRNIVRRLICEITADGVITASTLGKIIYLDQPFTLEPHNAPLEPEPLP